MSVTTFTPRKKVFILALVAVIIDQLSKFWVVANLEGKPAIEVFSDLTIAGRSILSFTVTRNTGASFGIGSEITYVFSILAFVVIGLILFMAKNFTNNLWVSTLGLMMGGAAGNLLDRIFRAPGFFQGGVVDFISVERFSIFNLADTFITIAAIGIILLTLLKIDEKTKE